MIQPVRAAEWRKPFAKDISQDGWIEAQKIWRPRLARNVRMIADWTVQKACSVSRCRNRWECMQYPWIVPVADEDWMRLSKSSAELEIDGHRVNFLNNARPEGRVSAARAMSIGF